MLHCLSHCSADLVSCIDALCFLIVLRCSLEPLTLYRQIWLLLTRSAALRFYLFLKPLLLDGVGESSGCHKNIPISVAHVIRVHNALIQCANKFSIGIRTNSIKDDSALSLANQSQSFPEQSQHLWKRTQVCLGYWGLFRCWFWPSSRVPGWIMRTALI